MAAPVATGAFAAGELERLDRAFGGLPPGHLLPPRGLRRLFRKPVLRRGDRVYASVLALFAGETQSAYLFDAAFSGATPGSPASDSSDLVALVAHVLVGCSLSVDADLDRAFAGLIGRTETVPRVVLLELGALRGGAHRPGGAALDLRALPPGIDLGLAYALFVEQPVSLRASAPEVFTFLQQRLFAPEARLAASDDQAAITAARIGVVRG